MFTSKRISCVSCVLINVTGRMNVFRRVGVSLNLYEENVAVNDYDCVWTCFE